MNAIWAIELNFEAVFTSIGGRAVDLWRVLAQAYVTEQQRRIVAQVDPWRLHDAGLMTSGDEFQA